MSKFDVLVPSSAIDQMGLTPEQLMVKLAILASLCRNHILFQAQRGLRSSMQNYIGGIHPETVNGFNAYVTLVGRFPNMIEWGIPPFNLRDTLLKADGRKVKVSKDGHRFLRVPFRHMGEGTTGRYAPAMGQPYARVLGRTEVKRITSVVMSAVEGIRSKSPTVADPSGGLIYGGRVPANMGGPILRARHVTGIYAGMLVVQKTYPGGRTSSMGMTFRTISDNPATFRSDSGGMNWMHPGISPRRFFEKTQRYLKMIAPSVLGAGGPTR